MGIDPNLAGLLAYLLGWVTGLVFFLVEKENKFVRFHAMQSIMLSVSFFVIYVVLFVAAFLPYVSCFTSIISFVAWIGYVVLTIVCMVKAYQGEWFRLPIIGDMAEKQA